MRHTRSHLSMSFAASRKRQTFVRTAKMQVSVYNVSPIIYLFQNPIRVFMLPVLTNKKTTQDQEASTTASEKLYCTASDVRSSNYRSEVIHMLDTQVYIHEMNVRRCLKRRGKLRPGRQTPPRSGPHIFMHIIVQMWYRAISLVLKYSLKKLRSCTSW